MTTSGESSAVRNGACPTGGGCQGVHAVHRLGLFVLLMIPPFDVVAGKVWGPVILLVGLVGTIATFAYFIRGHRRVRNVETNPSWWWLAWTLWYCALLFGASVLQDRRPVTWTGVGVASALPLLVVGIRLRRRATA